MPVQEGCCRDAGPLRTKRTSHGNDPRLYRLLLHGRLVCQRGDEQAQQDERAEKSPRRTAIDRLRAGVLRSEVAKWQRATERGIEAYGGVRAVIVLDKQSRRPLLTPLEWLAPL